MDISDNLGAYVDFSDEELADVLSFFKKEVFLKKELIVRKDQICNKLYFVKKGMARSFYLKDGKEVTQWFFDEQQFMTSVESFFEHKNSLYYLEVIEDSVLFSISKESLDMLFVKYQKMEKFGRLLSIEMLTKIVNKLNAIQFQTAKERYDYMLKEFPNITYRVPLGYVASYLGMTQETLSRIRKGD